MANLLAVPEFLNAATSTAILDVRSPGEFAKGHIPGAFSFPLFSDEERKIVGTLYKEKGKDEAILAGLDFVGPKMSGFVRNAKAMVSNQKILVHCWRGGMRSGSMAWLLQSAGLDVSVLIGGYKSFRNSVLNQSPIPDNIVILGGYSGSRKTEILHCLAQLGEQIIDLEDLAKHQGSTFGRLEDVGQPTQEQFENILFMCLRQINPDKRTWIEDESLRIGNLNILPDLYARMRSTQIVFMDISLEERTAYTVLRYGDKSLEDLASAFERIKKRLGGLNYKQAMDALKNHDLETAARIALEYYDKAYLFGYDTREPESKTQISCNGQDNGQIATMLIAKSQIPSV